MFLKIHLRKRIAIGFLFITTTELLHPLVSYALTSGPSQPEFSSFSPVTATDMVDKFTGDFNYSIPVLEVPGPQGSSYPLALAYHSGSSPEEEASWVGAGWTLNPGAITRGTRGFPDDYNKDAVTYWNKVPRNWTATLGVGASVELFSADGLGKLNTQAALRYNNYTGFGYNYGLGVSFGKGLISLGYQETDSRHSFSANINPAALLSKPFSGDNKRDGNTPQPSASPVTKKDLVKGGLQRQAMQMLGRASSINLLGGNHGLLDYSETNRATQATQYTGASFNVSAGVEGNPTWLPAGVTANLFGSYSYQDNVPQSNLSAAGFMYAAEADESSMSDYYTEKASSYNKRDAFLGIPFNNADAFNVSGEGLGGSFRLHHDRTGEFGPNKKKSEIDIANLSVEFDVPASPQGNLGVGFDAGIGTQSLEEGSWGALESFSLKPFSSVASPSKNDDPYGEGAYFKFANEMTVDSRQQAIDDQPLAAYLTPAGAQKYKPGYDNALLEATGEVSTGKARDSRGSYIGYHTLAQMNSRPTRYCKRTDIAGQAYSGAPADRIGEISVVNEQGKRFNYGLPLYSQREKNLQYGVQGTGASNIAQHNFIAYTNKEETKVGEERNAPYATTYLLTETTTSDYVDRSLDGPTNDDFGGYTRFEYVKKNSLSGTPYHWRLPYTGHIYEKNSLSDPLDDMGTVSEGDKEVAYLRTIRTKTHTAIFTVSVRDDSYDADNTGAARINPNARGTHPLYKLERIDLYANADVVPNADPSVWTPLSTAKPIKTVRFEYSYELCLGVPNNVNGNGGKLTLKRMWFEYQNLTYAKINPYEFEYKYPQDPTIYPSVYQSRLTDGYSAYSQTAQNPGYSPTNVDAWGNYQAQGDARYDSLQTWVNQRPNSADFDPAAWQLKVIRLPSKAELHVQYEQDDYAFVQGEVTHAFASLKADLTNGLANEFLIDPLSVGVSGTSAVEAIRDSINAIYGTRRNKLFFKFLYNLTSASRPDVTQCNTDYVSGYVDLDGAARIETINGRKFIAVKVGNSSSSYSLPYQVCQDFVKTQRRGKISSAGNCDPAASGVPSNDASPKQIVQQLTSFLGSLVDPSGMCAGLNPRLSYFKIPLPSGKKGGGVRVKRLLTYANDPALDNERVVYGSEYSYNLAGSKLTSGVATNEPAAMRGENALVHFIPRGNQSLLSKIVAGEDRKQSEGPIGESVLPAPSVGYSRVVERNIHSGKSNPGFTVSEFYTAHDFPVQYQMTDITRRNYYKPSFGGLVTSTVNNEWATQGFSVILNNMHGQPRRTATYAGDYAAIDQTLTGATLVTEQLQEYFLPSSPGPVSWNAPDQGSDRPTYLPGREVDVTMAQHAVKDFCFDASMEFDNTFGIVFIFPIPFITARLSLAKNESAIYTHATSKVVRYPAIVKSVRLYKDGIYHLEENLALDQYTGKPVAVRSQDEFNGSYLREDAMAAWVYPEKQSKAQNEGIVLASTGSAALATVTSVGTSAPGSYYLSPTAAQSGSPNVCDVLRYLRKGDLLALNGKSNLYTAGAVDYARNQVQLFPTVVSANLASAIQNITVIASGNTNELAEEAGSTTYHKDKAVMSLRSNSGQPQSTSFLTQFNAQLAAGGANGSGGFTLAGPFYSMDVSGFYNRLPAALKPQAHSLDIQNMVFTTYTANGTTKYTLISFQVLDGVNPPWTID